MTSHTLEELMRLGQQGDSVAYRALLQEVQILIERYVSKRVYARSEKEDVVQEILLSLHKARHTWQPDKPFTPWLYAICNFRVQDYLRRVYRSKEDASDTFEDTTMDDSATIDIILENKQLSDQALSQLNDKQRKIITALYIKDLSAQEAADALQLSVSDIRTTAHRALKKLQEYYKTDTSV